MSEEIEGFKITVDRDAIVELINEGVRDRISEELRAQSEHITMSIGEYFKKGFFRDIKSKFDNALDYTVDEAFRQATGTVMKEMNFTELVAEAARKMMTDEGFIQELAEAKVRASLGLPKKEN